MRLYAPKDTTAATVAGTEYVVAKDGTLDVDSVADFDVLKGLGFSDTAPLLPLQKAQKAKATKAYQAAVIAAAEAHAALGNAEGRGETPEFQAALQAAEAADAAVAKASEAL